MKYTKIAFLIAVLAVVLVAPAFAFALTTSDNGDSTGTPATQDNGLSGTVISVPPTQDNGSSASNAGTPPTQDNGTSAGGTTVPPTQDNGSSAGGTTVPPTQDNGTSANNPNPTSTPAPTNPGNGNGNGSGPSSSGGSSSGGSSSSSGSSYRTTCQFLTSYLNVGASGAEVTKLQNFLKTNGFNIGVTGLYDAQTVSAVSAFQTKYAKEILTPWGIQNPTGRVFMTTLKKINNIACSTPLTLTPAELALLNANKAGVANGTIPATQVVGKTPSVSGSVIAVGTTTSVDSTDNGTSTDDTQVASASRASILSKIWNFIKRIFGR